MNLILFSRLGIHFEDRRKGDVDAIFVPMQDDIRRYTDITNPTTSSVKDRYGSDLRPLWRQKGTVVNVFGQMNRDLLERRHALKVFLPQDYVKPSTDVFFFVFGEKWIVHGVKSQSDDGLEVWGISKLDVRDQDVADVLMATVSERMLEGQEEETLIAVHGENVLFDTIQKRLEPLNITPVRFDTLERQKSIKPLYKHGDHSLLMLIGAMFSALLLVAAIGYLVVGVTKLGKLDEEIAQIDREIRKIQSKRVLGHIQNPEAILKKIESPLPVMPSSVIHYGAEAAAAIGELKSLSVAFKDTQNQGRGRRSRSTGQLDTVTVKTDLSSAESSLLVDQENIAQTVIAKRPWVLKIERVGQVNRGQVMLETELKVK